MIISYHRYHICLNCALTYLNVLHIIYVKTLSMCLFLSLSVFFSPIIINYQMHFVFFIDLSKSCTLYHSCLPTCTYLPRYLQYFASTCRYLRHIIKQCVYCLPALTSYRLSKGMMFQNVTSDLVSTCDERNASISSIFI